MTMKNRPNSPSSARPAGRKGRRVSPWAWVGLAVPLVALLVIIIAGSVAGEPGSAIETQQAPRFTLSDTAGGTASLDQILARGDVLLYFSMGVGCDGCFDQIPEVVDALQAKGVQLVPIMVDPADMVTMEAARFGITVPILIDESREVSQAYGMLGVYGHSDRPSHSFALVRADGTVASVKHYATMFVPLDQLLTDMGLA
jgi:peroxiredoxin